MHQLEMAGGTPALSRCWQLINYDWVTQRAALLEQLRCGDPVVVVRLLGVAPPAAKYNCPPSKPKQ